MLRSQTLKRIPRRQRGFTLIELIVVIAIAAVLVVGLALFGVGMYNKQKGVEEGKRVTAVVNCGVDYARSIASLTSVTLPVLVNSGCFGNMPGITNRGTNTASATSPLTGDTYTVSAVNLVGTNDGLTMTGTTQAKHCTGVVEGAVSSGAIRVNVTPSGGSAVTVKPLTGELDVAALGLSTACNGAEPIAVQIAVAK
ncbi:type II secretion system protein [Ramlibacter albus]|uniref:Type II secretion system protein n=1 Tax=Ramlibacter albus TaxID=2079448 RepID=A0A923MC36_9BURK|nr:type II secretion system protein [Ramlibacter albus]MBC5767643.1 type II secretion system protein [Ramlibacter albus]